MDKLLINGFSGAISKMMMEPGRDLYDMDEDVDEEFGIVDDYDQNQQQLQGEPDGLHRIVGNGSDTSEDYPTIGTTNTDETADFDSRGGTPPKATSKSLKQLEAGQQLDPRTDPFAPRPGKTLLWRNVNMTLMGKKGKPDRPLLSNVWGEVPETETTAIMGASGAGKTSLLNILSGRAATNGRIRIEADVRLNNYSVDPTNIKVRQHIAFVAQDDSLQATSTPREAIRFSAKLRLPRTTTDAQLDQLATRMVNELGLASCADTFVGGPLLKGISGGERKRASVGVELVVKPSMVFLDEPTSGLDAFSAVQVCQVLKKVANAGASVLFTIHQPSSEIFQSFDRLILMNKGSVMFQGPVSIIPQHFARLGYPIPCNYNPADWVINVAQSNSPAELLERGFFQNDDRVIDEPYVPEPGQDFLGLTVVGKFGGDLTRYQSDSNSPNDEARHGFKVQAYYLTVREFKFFYRFPLPIYARFGISAILSLLVGVVYWQVGQADSAVQFNVTSQFGGIMILMVFSMLGCAQPAIMFFPEERPIFVREYSTNHYSVAPYFASRLILETVLTSIQLLIINVIMWNMIKFRGRFIIFYLCSYTLAMTSTALAVTLGIISRGNAKVATQLLPVVLLPQFLFSGFFVSPALIPAAMRWVVHICPLSYAVKIIAVEEFYNCSEDNFSAELNCQLLLTNIGANPEDTWYYWILLVVLFVVFRLYALWLLKRGASKFY